MMLLGRAEATVIRDSKKTALGIVALHDDPFWLPCSVTKFVTTQTPAVWFGYTLEYSSKRLKSSGNHIIKP